MRFLNCRRRRSQVLAVQFATSPPMVVVKGLPRTDKGRLLAEGVSGLIDSMGQPVQAVSWRRVTHGMTGGSILIVPPPEALGITDVAEVVAGLRRTPAAFGRVALLGWQAAVEGTPLLEFLRHPRAMATVSDEATYAALKSAATVELDFDPSIYLPGFGPSLRDPKWRTRFDRGFRPAPRSEPPLVAVGQSEAGDGSAASLGNLLRAIVHSNGVVTDRWHVALCAVLLGQHVEYVDSESGRLSASLRHHFRGAEEIIATRHDQQWLVDEGYSVGLRGYGG